MRERQRLSQQRLAALTRGQPWKVSRPVISAIERGEHLPSFEALVGLSRVLQFDPRELLERAELAAAPPVDLTDQGLDELAGQARDLALAGAYREALAVYDAMLERLVLDPGGDTAATQGREAEIETFRAGALLRCGALLGSEAAAKRAIALSSDRPEIRSLAYAILAKNHVERGILPLARDHARRAVELATDAGPRAEGRARLELGEVLFVSGDVAEARETFLEARRLLRAAEDRAHYSHVEGNVGLCHAAAGAADQARTWFRRALDLAREQGLPILEARWLTELGRLAYDVGRLEEADRYAAAAAAIARPREHWLTLFRAEWLRHRIVGKKDAKAPDRQRLALLRKLLVHLADHRTEREIREFRELFGEDPHAPPRRRR